MGYVDGKVDVPEGALDGIRVERFTFDHEASMWSYLREGARGIPAGTYTRLIEGNRVWMSDTPAELRDHAEVIHRLHEPTARRVLINGLGLGMVVKAALSHDHVEHVDVVERDPRVVRLVGPHYAADPRVSLIEEDAFAQARRWPSRTRWDVVWHDIWPDIDADNLPDMARLHRSYGRRAGWQGSWGKELILLQRRRERAHLRAWEE